MGVSPQIHTSRETPLIFLLSVALCARRAGARLWTSFSKILRWSTLHAQSPVVTPSWLIFNAWPHLNFSRLWSKGKCRWGREILWMHTCLLIIKKKRVFSLSHTMYNNAWRIPFSSPSLSVRYSSQPNSKSHNSGSDCHTNDITWSPVCGLPSMCIAL